ncbi:MAG: CoA-acylating methylmalonate-semialdehyde dehydrogenase [Deltaproteobacteria bacterium]|nr:CoA-acylating methylmalonate-semialdehyde dehydrogenase [Deltaproteobacteria bacterium]
MVETLKNYINGEWVSSLGTESLDVDNPATGELTSKVPVGVKADVDAAVAAAKEAFPAWAAIPPVQRARYLFKFKTLLEEHKSELALLCTKDHGKTIAESESDVGRGIENVEHACGIPTLMMSDFLEDIAGGIDCHSARQPLGVFAAITPFNFPPMVPFWFLPYAIATGNTFVLKTSEQVPDTWMRIMELLEQTGLPKGVVNLIHGAREVVETIVNHDDIEGVSFVGSTKVAKTVYEACGKTGKRVQSLGGAKNHLVVMPDAVMKPSVQNLSDSAYGCAGQRCLAASVAVAVGDAYEPMKKMLIQAVKDIKMGDGSKDGVTLGPVISKAAKERILMMVEKGVSEGAELLVDRRNEVPAGLEGGHWVGPVLFDKVQPGCTIATEEIFGPVLSIIQVDTLDEAIALTNSSRYGNATSIYTSSGKAARQYRKEAAPAMLGVNIGVAAPMAFFPFGGSKDSFFGDVKAHGRDSVSFYTDRKVSIERWF